MAAGNGSVSKTSSAAPLNALFERALTSAASWTTGPRPNIDQHRAGFMAANSGSPIIPSVSGVSGAAATT